MSELSTRLKESRLKAGKSQAEVAEAVGIKQPTYQALESGKTQKVLISLRLLSFLVWMLIGFKLGKVIPTTHYVLQSS